MIKIKKQQVKSNLEDFCNTYGVGLKRVKRLTVQKGFNPALRSFALKSAPSSKIIKSFKKTLHGKVLREKLKKKLHFLWKIKTYKGIRHMLRLPARGQRTHTNARTKKKFKFF